MVKVPLVEVPLPFCVYKLFNTHKLSLDGFTHH
jgi:hypothetical protein